MCTTQDELAMARQKSSDLFQLSTEIVGMICIYSSHSSIFIILGVVQMQLVFRPWNH